ncbi:uncharacterized protein PG998_001132 [Apiospora kogelbergensis]|uniref:uncharacterized protein n=1 Tax=Apiospora kogelbergensis TaxID=1337665 RepID=UPI0031304A51
MSLSKISPGVYIAVIPQDLEQCFAHMSEECIKFWKHFPAEQITSPPAQESSTDSDARQPGSSAGPFRSPTHPPIPTQSDELCGCYAGNTLPRRPPPTTGPPPPRPDPCIPKGHVVVMLPEVPPPGPETICSQGHVIIVIPREYVRAGRHRHRPPPGPEAGSASTADSEATASVLDAGPTSEKDEKQSSTAECVPRSDSPQLPGWYEQ